MRTRRSLLPHLPIRSHDQSPLVIDAQSESRRSRRVAISKRGRAIVTNRQREISDRPVPVGTGTRDRWLRIFLACVMLSALLAAPTAAIAFQSPDESSPATGTAQIVAQGVVPIEAGDLAWQIVDGMAGGAR